LGKQKPFNTLPVSCSLDIIELTASAVCSLARARAKIALDDRQYILNTVLIVHLHNRDSLIYAVVNPVELQAPHTQSGSLTIPTGDQARAGAQLPDHTHIRLERFVTPQTWLSNQPIIAI
jgi:hypothetical protein